MSRMPIALTVAGTDPTGGAGVLADIKTFHSQEVFGMAAITALTAQNTIGVQDVHNIPGQFLQEQLDSIFSDEVPDAMKSGMIANEEMMAVIKECVERHQVPYIIDPVMIATSGDPLIDGDAAEFLRTQLLPLALTVTPNIHEAEKISGQQISSEGDIKKAADIFLNDIGVQSVVITGGHLDSGPTDYLFTADNAIELSETRIDTTNTHGTGCTFSAVMTAEVAKGKSIEESFRTAKRYITSAIRHNPNIGKGTGPVSHFSYKGE